MEIRIDTVQSQFRSLMEPENLVDAYVYSALCITRPHMNDYPVLELQDVFVLSGVPKHTFVEPVE